MRGAFRNSISAPRDLHLQRPRLGSESTNGSTTTKSSNGSNNSTRPSALNTNSPSENVIPALDAQDQKPIASGNGVVVGIHLAEPVLFVQGFEHTDSSSSSTAMLRGSLHLRVQKSAKIKAITLKFKGKAVTKWPEGIPPKKTDFEESSTIMSHTWPFFNAQFENAEKGTNADHVQLANPLDGSMSKLDSIGRSTPTASNANLTSKEAKRLSLQVNQSRSFNTNDSTPGSTVSSKGYRTFLPGDYIYNFELPIDSRLPETIDVELGSVKYELEASIERSGAFRANLSGTKEVVLIRAPAEGSLEQVEPIAISRNWEDQLHYDIVISGKSFPLGTQVPIAFKLTPLAKVQCHRIKVLITENVEYFCSNKRVHRMEPQRKVQLFEKRADSAPVSAFPGSTMRVTAGGGIPYNQRVAAANGEHVVPQDTTNLLGPLSNPDDRPIGPTEMEFNVQLPSCQLLRDRDRAQRLHFDTTYQNIQVHHWIKIVMRLSRQDENDPKKRRHFEISIDSPFHILSCRATQANISLPAYSSPQGGPGVATLYECGCPDAARRRNSPTSFAPTLNALNSARTGDDQPNGADTQLPNLARPQQAHIHGPHAPERPMHLLRHPSFNPPAFEDEQPPPALITPPPQYNDIASPTSGLADYFSRLSDAYESDDEDEAHRSGRVNVPLTPGGRINRSMDLGRSWLPVGHA
ncbi:putative arrestin-related trafficking adapter c2d10.04 [Acrodontium crateriforme]|uniref:Arrestin-related trafficking adapter c2d10.04 n=1 Tax=Acrodontium crateriforme TaxID=150365 RepID=A0AAQ3M8V2_9PEZI|nr:putative arrestin-related trafficking adapter c2d10.04 [Acrodontium crateriforme]